VDVDALGYSSIVKKYLIRPSSHGLDMSAPSLHQDLGHADWPAQNFKISQKSVMKRYGYGEDRDLGEGVDVQAIIYYKKSDGTIKTIYLTPTNAMVRESSGTWSYINVEYITGEIDTAGVSVNVITGADTPDWVDTGDYTAPAIGDYFIIDDDHSSTAEPDPNWGIIESIDSDTQITLIDAYTGASTDGDYTVSKQYAVPDGERWSWAVVNDSVYFSNGADYVQVYTGSGKATQLNTTSAIKARYLIEYANRLIMADYGSTRAANGLAWSKEGDPSDWTDDTAGSTTFLQSDDYITGLGKVGGSLVVYQRDSLIFGQRTGIATAPISFGRTKRGVGCIAPYSIVDVRGTNAFFGRDDVYIIDGESPYPVGEKIRDKLFSVATTTELEKAYGYNNTLQNEVRWFVTDTDSNRLCFVWNYKLNEWYYHDFNDAMSCGGKGQL